jgi:lactate permease
MAVFADVGKDKRLSPLSASARAVWIVGIVALCLCAAILLNTNSVRGRWSQNYDPTGHWLLSALLAAAPIVVVLGSLAILRFKAYVAAAAGLLTALVVAIAVFHMPVRMALTAATFGAGYGLFPICWIVLPVLFLCRMMVETGHAKALHDSLVNISEDSRLQLLIIAFIFGAFIEGAAGLGAPVAACGAILITLGFRPVKAAGLCMIADTAPVAFGALGLPILALHNVTGLGTIPLAATVSHILLPFCVLVPFWVVWAFAGLRATLEVWPPILLTGVFFGVTQMIVAESGGPTLVAMTASTLTLVVLLSFLQFWQPKRVLDVELRDITDEARSRHGHDAVTVFKAWLPWMIFAALGFVWGIPQVSGLLNLLTVSFPVAGLHNLVLRTSPVVATHVAETAVFQLNWAASSGTAIFLAAIVAGVCMKVSAKSMVRIFVKTAINMRSMAAIFAAMLAIASVTRYCGMDATIGLAFAHTGVLYPFFAALIGWLGVATTGSNTVSNMLFGSLQTVTANQVGLPATLMASANSAGGVMGKIINAQTIVTASAATQSEGQEGSILRSVFFHALALAALVGIFVMLIAYVPPFAGLVAQ